MVFHPSILHPLHAEGFNKVCHFYLFRICRLSCEFVEDTREEIYFFATLPIINRTASFIFTGSISIPGCLFLKTRNISSAKAWPTIGTWPKSKMTCLNFSSPTVILLACEREMCIVPSV